MKKIFSIALALCLLMSLAVPASAAEGYVRYTGHNIFGFGPGSEYSKTDLFDNFKGAMPGDVLTQEITVSNTARCCDFIRVYLRAETHSEKGNPLSSKVSASGETVATMKEFLSKLSMKVYNGEKLIYRASPDELGGLEENVLLGKLRKNQDLNLTVELSVPAELGNEYANRVGEVDWVFQVEEFDDKNPDVPKTGDTTPIGLYLGVMAGSLFLLILLLFRKKKKQ